MIFKGLIEYLI